MPGKQASCQRFLVRLLQLFAASLLLAPPMVAQAPAVQPQYEQEHFTRQEVMIPARDGIHLETVIFTPRQLSSPLPILLVRTPYGVPADEKGLDSGRYDDLIADGYIFVMQNIRGRFKSEGQFVMQRPVRDKATPNPSTREPTPMTPLTGWSKTFPTITDESGCGEFHIPDGW